MAKFNGVIQEVEEKTSKTGNKYWRVKISDTWYTNFNADLNKEVYSSIGDEVLAETVTKGNYTTLVSIGLPEEGMDQPKNVNEAVDKLRGISKDKKGTNGGSETAIYTSYAKDLFVTMYGTATELSPEQVMKYAVKLVKQAKKEFE